MKKKTLLFEEESSPRLLEISAGTNHSEKISFLSLWSLTLERIYLKNTQLVFNNDSEKKNYMEMERRGSSMKWEGEVREGDEGLWV